VTGVAAYLTPEAQARIDIDRMLGLAGWAVQDPDKVNLAAARGVAVREFILEPGHGRADYLLFVDREVVGVLEAKPAGTVLVNVEPQRDDYAEGIAFPTTSRLRSSRSRSSISRPASRRGSRTRSILTRAHATCSPSTGPRRSVVGSPTTTR
jgi:hypothetical protein